MILSRIAWLTVLAVLCVAAIFFFPAIKGPYSAVNGPVTALQSARSATRVRVAIVLAAFGLMGNFETPSLVYVGTATIVYIQPQARSCSDCGTILRC